MVATDRQGKTEYAAVWVRDGYGEPAFPRTGRFVPELEPFDRADQRLTNLYGDQDAWTEKVILNIASSGKFSSDRTIAEYAADIWNVEPCPVS